MGFFQDMLAVFKKKELVFVESRRESEDVHSFLFEKRGDLSWKAGQYGLFHIAHTTVKKPTRPFSIASAPAENVVRITTVVREAPSDFKKALLELKPGMKVKVSGPVGGFHLEAGSPSLLIAGGIGITPFRSILKQIEAEGNGDGKTIQLLYLDSRKSYLYKDEFDQIAAKHPSIKVSYLESRDELKQEIEKFTALNKNNGKYLIAGSKSFVDAVAETLTNNQIAKGNIKKDSFFGY
ncbi:oxidoreductase [Cohnella sp. CIP 111063]|uniref:FAD-dependent oxidoreductase n=1 Tax=unclassified Cohnella TaxID=2636738 RepID=UPI000B8BCB36|nr:MULTISPECIES: FAD-dependent oxidoreductase [unclassified Cohnella]OXS57334.1 oxidoreductase [Cohnella sp. CIP 111063]PRX70774.1 ferredoxin-NADP reductase [Cohnella sp. SGD-V74]